MINLQNSKVKWLFLSVGVISMLLSGPTIEIGITGWLIPLGILYFTRASHPVKGYLWAALFIMFISIVGGLFTSPMPLIVSVLSAPIAAFPAMLPYLIDRLLYKRLSPILACFLFPALAVILEYSMSFIFSSIGALAATQTHFLEFIQLASVTGVFGVSFMMYWFASVSVSFLRKETYAKNHLKYYAIAMAIIMVFGWIRMRSVKEVRETVKASGIAVEEYEVYEALYEDFFGEPIDLNVFTMSSPEMGNLLSVLPEMLKDPDNEKYLGTQEAIIQFGNKLIDLTINEARSGSQIIVWSETNLMIFKKNESAYLERLKEVAKNENVVIVPSMGVLLPYVEGGPMYENTSYLITPEGKIADSFEKAKPVPMMDSSLPGDGIIESIHTPFGNLNMAICYDADFPDLMSQSGKGDILLLPSNDWLGISPYHGNNASFRAIENGVSIVRPTGSGQSVVFDPYGNPLARVDAFENEIRIINAYVPKKGVTTVYNLIGNTFIWLTVFLAFIILVKSIIGNGNKDVMESDV